MFYIGPLSNNLGKIKYDYIFMTKKKYFLNQFEKNVFNFSSLKFHIRHKFVTQLNYLINMCLCFF